MQINGLQALSKVLVSVLAISNKDAISDFLELSKAKSRSWNIHIVSNLIYHY